MNIILSVICFMTINHTDQVTDYLAGMEKQDRENTEIQLEWSGSITGDMEQAAALWNKGEFEQAISLVRDIENRVDGLAVVVNFRHPVTTANPYWATDIKVNTGNYGYRETELVFAENGNIFVIAHGVYSVNQRLHVYMSTDGGVNWALTGEMGNGTNDIPDVDAAEVSGHIYVAYATESAPTYGRVRRVNTNTGAFDTGYGYVNAIPAAYDIYNVSIEPNRTSEDEIYYTAIDISRNLHFYYASTSSPSTWTGIPTNVTDAERGLDSDYGYIAGAGHFLWISYIDTDDYLCVRGRSSTAWSANNMLASVSSLIFHSTAVAQHGDDVIAFYVSPSNLLRYQITYNDGSTWSSGGSSIWTGSAGAIDVTGRGNEGWHMCFSSFSTTQDMHYSSRGYASGSWETAQLIGEHDVYLNYKPSIDYLGTNGSYGLVYIDDNNDIWFDRSDWQPGVLDHEKKSDPSCIIELAPNPCHDFTKLNITLNRHGIVRMSVYDISGRMVKIVQSEAERTGMHTVDLNVQDLAAGVYLVSIKTPDKQIVKTMTIIQ
jgi:hypothetical protein